tara:strand:- start:69 stop:371 length:303 start_codon:yes stop_codon:yes gene_type:complete
MNELQLLKLISWIKRGRQRKLVLTELQKDQPIFAEELRKSVNDKIKSGTKLSLREVSRQLSGFKEKKIVICLDEELPWGRSYLLTKLGSKIKQLYSKTSQ